ncbi:MAG: hypothetical protein ACC683_00630 [Acidimicrobiia bacterium]
MVKPLISIGVVLAVLAAACTVIAGESDAVFEPFAGLECPTERYWGEFAYIADDAEGLQTPAAAVEAGLARWESREDGEVTVIDDLEGASTMVGALVVDGNRVVVVFPTTVRAGGWLTMSTVGCEGYEP